MVRTVGASGQDKILTAVLLKGEGRVVEDLLLFEGGDAAPEHALCVCVHDVFGAVVVLVALVAIVCGLLTVREDE